MNSDFEKFVYSCSILAGRVSLAMIEDEEMVSDMEENSVFTIELVHCDTCLKELQFDSVCDQYEHEFGWIANIYQCDDCGTETRGIQPNNSHDLLAFIELCKEYLTSNPSKKKVSKKTKKQLREILNEVNVSVSQYPLVKQLKEKLDDHAAEKKELSESIEFYCNALKLEKYRVESGNLHLGSC